MSILFIERGKTLASSSRSGLNKLREHGISSYASFILGARPPGREGWEAGGSNGMSERSDAVKEASDGLPDKSDVAQDASDLVLDKSRIAKEGSGVAPDKSRIAKEGSGIAPDKSRIAKEGSGIAPDKSDMAKEGSGIAPDKSDVAKEASGIEPDNSDVAKEGSFGAWERTKHHRRRIPSLSFLPQLPPPASPFFINAELLGQLLPRRQWGLTG